MLGCVQAQACLGVLPSSVAAAAQRSFIAGVLRLRDFGVEVPPLQCFQVSYIDILMYPCHKLQTQGSC